MGREWLPKRLEFELACSGINPRHLEMNMLLEQMEEGSDVQKELDFELVRMWRLGWSWATPASLALYYIQLGFALAGISEPLSRLSALRNTPETLF